MSFNSSSKRIYTNLVVDNANKIGWMGGKKERIVILLLDSFTHFDNNNNSFCHCSCLNLFGKPVVQPRVCFVIKKNVHTWDSRQSALVSILKRKNRNVYRVTSCYRDDFTTIFLYDRIKYYLCLKIKRYFHLVNEYRCDFFERFSLRT